MFLPLQSSSWTELLTWDTFFYKNESSKSLSGVPLPWSLIWKAPKWRVHECCLPGVGSSPLSWARGPSRSVMYDITRYFLLSRGGDVKRDRLHHIFLCWVHTAMKRATQIYELWETRLPSKLILFQPRGKETRRQKHISRHSITHPTARANAGDVGMYYVNSIHLVVAIFSKNCREGRKLKSISYERKPIKTASFQIVF